MDSETSDPAKQSVRAVAMPARAVVWDIDADSPGSNLRSALAYAWNDWWSGTRNVDLWWTLARYDIVLRYRRSMLGPLWLTISMGLMLIGVGPLYSVLFNVSRSDFFPHLTLGIIFWNYFSTTVNDGCLVFIGAARYLKQGEFPASIFVWRSITKHVIQLAHHIVLFVPVAIWCNVAWSWNALWFVPGFIITLVNLHAMTISLGIICARFRDVTQMVASVMQLMMFLTPVFWFPRSLSGTAKAILYNPWAQMLDVVRLPLLGSAPTSGTWWFLLDITLLNVGIAALLYAFRRRQLAYWV